MIRLHTIINDIALASTADLRARGVQPRDIEAAVAEGKLYRVAPGLVATYDVYTDSRLDDAIACRRHGAVIGYLTAAARHDLCDAMPDAIQVFVPASASRPTPGQAIQYIRTRNPDALTVGVDVEDYRNLHRVFSARRTAGTLSELHHPKTPELIRERQCVVDYLNHYELVSIGISREILDYKIYNDWIGGPFVRDWNDASEFIQQERWQWDSTKRIWLYRERQYKEFQKMAKRMSAEAKTIDSGTSPHPPSPGGPEDAALPILDADALGPVARP